MKTTMAMALTVAWAGLIPFRVFADASDYGEPGFRMFSFHDDDYMSGYRTDSLWESGNVLRTIYPDKLYAPQSDAFPEYTTYAYGAYMFMEANVTYTFHAYYDDYATVKVDDSMVIGLAGCASQTGSVCFQADGWHRLELRVANEYGSGGSLGGVGILYSTSKDSTKRRMTDYGTGEVFRVGPEPATFTEYTAIGVESITMRANDPTIMDVEYYGYGSDNADVRMVAFKDGVRSFANIIRPETFVEGTETNLGNNVSIKGRHKISWRVSSDWNIDLAKVSVEFLVKTTPELIPMKFVTIPAMGGKKAMKLSVSGPSNAQVFNAILWCYADKDPDFSVSGGYVYYKGKRVAERNGCYCYMSNHAAGVDEMECDWYDDDDARDYAMLAVEAFWDKLGYQYLRGTDLDYAKKATRLPLYNDNDGWGAVWLSTGSAYKWLDE